MADIKKVIDEDGIIVLADAWLAGGFGRKDSCILEPADATGRRIRSAGATFAEMLAGAGASIVPIPSREVYNALQTGRRRRRPTPRPAASSPSGSTSSSSA